MKTIFRIILLGLLLFIFHLTACKKTAPVEKVKPVDHSKTKAVINGRECHMFTGYYSDPDNRTFAGQENRDNVYLCFYSQYMAENYLAKNSKDNDTIYWITISFYAPKKDFRSNTHYTFNRTKDSTDIWHSQFEESVFESYVLCGTITSKALLEEELLITDPLAANPIDYSITKGWVSFGDIETEPHLLYGGDRFVWKCQEAFFEFDAVSDNEKVLHVTDGYCCL